jgi:hypothetical protein
VLDVLSLANRFSLFSLSLLCENYIENEIANNPSSHLQAHSRTNSFTTDDIQKMQQQHSIQPKGLGSSKEEAKKSSAEEESDYWNNMNIKLSSAEIDMAIQAAINSGNPLLWDESIHKRIRSSKKNIQQWTISRALKYKGIKLDICTKI